MKALVFVATTCIVMKVGMSSLHSRQVVKTREFLKNSADAALAEDDQNRAFDLYEQYLILSPGDVEVQETVADLLQKHGNTAQEMQRAFAMNERLLLKDQSRDDLRVKQVKLAEKLGRYNEAAGHLKALRAKDSKIPEVWHYSGVIAEDTGDFTEAMEFYQTAVGLTGTLPDTYARLSNLLTRDAHREADAEALLNQFVQESSEDEELAAKAHAIRARWLLGQQRPLFAVADLWAALKLDPANVRNNATQLKAIRLATESDQQFDSEDAYRRLVAHYNKLLEAEPNNSRIRLFLASALWSIDQEQPAIQALQEGIERDPRDYELYEVLVDFLVSDQQHELAQTYFDQIPRRALDRGRREFMRGRLRMSQKRWSEAIEAFELAVSLARGDKEMGSRARICLALCRRESGDTSAAMDAYKNLVQEDPNSEGGRLGIASAYLRSNRLPLAIAEYRQLLHVESVPPFLANLMIRHNLTLPRKSRNWDELEELLHPDNQHITDDVQRTLLTVDMLFAQGFPARAMAYLDDAVRRMPDQPEFQRAFERLNAVHGKGLQVKIRQALDDDPTNGEAHQSMLKLLVSRGPGEVQEWLNGLLGGSDWPRLQDEERYRILAETTSQVADAELATRGSTDQIPLLLQFAAEAWKRLSEGSELYLPGRIRFTTMYQSGQAAVSLLKQTETDSRLIRAESWVEIARYDRSMVTSVAQELIKLIQAEPSDFYLRLAYVDLQILSGQHEAAAKTLNSLVNFDAASGMAISRKAWLALLVSKNAQVAEQLSARATTLATNSPYVRAVRGLSLAESGRANQGRAVLESIPSSERTPSIQLFIARAQQLDGDRESAAFSLRQLMTRRAARGLAPAEKDLLNRLRSSLPTPQSD